MHPDVTKQVLSDFQTSDLRSAHHRPPRFLPPAPGRSPTRLATGSLCPSQLSSVLDERVPLSIGRPNVEKGHLRQGQHELYLTAEQSGTWLEHSKVQQVKDCTRGNSFVYIRTTAGLFYNITTLYPYPIQYFTAHMENLGRSKSASGRSQMGLPRHRSTRPLST